MFDNFAIVKLIEMQNEIDRARWRKDEDAFYRDLAGGDEARFSSVWRRFRGLVSQKRETDRRDIRRPVSNACCEVCDQAAR